MREFQLLRYLSKGKWIIFIVALLGASWVYFYANAQQVYTATTVIRYANDAIEDGLTPNGSKLDVNEIYSSTVIKGAIEDLGLSCSVDEVRSKIKVRAIIPEEEDEKKEAAISKGEDYSYFPTDYIITLEADSDKSRTYAGNLLDAVIKNYYMFYSERYVDQLILPNNAGNIRANDYDYIECAEIIQESVKSIDDFLLQKRSAYPDFRASATGYTFSDLENIYSYISNNKVPELYASILRGKFTKDNALLLKKQKDRIESLEINLANNQEKYERLKYLIENYSEKGINSTKNATQDASNESTGSTIIMDVDGYDRDLNVITTYDDLIQEYVQIDQSLQYDEIDKAHTEYLYSVFVDNKHNQVLNDAIDQEIDELVTMLNKEYAVVKATARELNEYIGASYLNILNSVVTSQKVNVKLYLVLALVFFLVFGCIGAVVIGRLIDFIQYIIYTDKNTKLPNRQKCDLQISSLSEKKLSGQFVCAIVQLDNLVDVNATLGRSAGDALLSEFGRIVKKASRNYGFMGYNNVGQFLGLFDQCTVTKAEVFSEILNKSVAEYNEKQIGVTIKYSVAYVNSEQEDVYEIRTLIRRAFEKLKHR